MQRADDIIELPLVITARSPLILELIQFLNGSGKPKLVAPDWKGHGLNVLDVLPDAIEQPPAPIRTAVEFFPLSIKGVEIAAARGRSPGAQLFYAAKVILEQIAIPGRHAIVTDHLAQRSHDVVELALVPAARGILLLQLVQLLFRSGQSVLVAAERKGVGLNVLYIVLNSLEEPLTPVLSAKPSLALPIECLWIAAATVPIFKTAPFRCATPEEIEFVLVRAAIRIVDPDHRSPAASRIAHQRLPASPIDAREAKSRRIQWHGSCAIEPAPLRRPAGEITKNRAIAPNFDFCGTIHYNFDSAPVRTAATDDGRPARKTLGPQTSSNRREPDDRK